MAHIGVRNMTLVCAPSAPARTIALLLRPYCNRIAPKGRTARPTHYYDDEDEGEGDLMMI